MINKPSFKYKAKVLDAYDGDTITILLDVGFKISIKERVRLYGIDAPEMRGEERPMGIISRDWLRGKILGKDIIVETFKEDKRKYGKYGRFLAILYLPDEQVNINQQMIDLGLAEVASY